MPNQEAVTITPRPDPTAIPGPAIPTAPAPTGSPLALVLGGGGLAGLAFHAGVLAALHHDLGWHPDRADLVVGTSAGSVAGALIRGGAWPEDLAAWASGATPTTEGAPLRRGLDRIRARPWLLRPRLAWAGPGPGTVRALFRGDPASAAATLAPPGWLEAGPGWADLARQLGPWPDRPLWITALTTDDTRLRVFGRDAFPPLEQAVTASCAVPGLFPPVVIDGRRHVDGGVRSATNADLVADAGVGHALIVSPLSGPRADPPGRRTGPAARWADRGPDPMRALARRSLEREVALLRERGVTVDVIEPDESTVRAMGRNLMSQGRLGPIVRAAFLAVAPQLSEPLRHRLSRPADQGQR